MSPVVPSAPAPGDNFNRLRYQAQNWLRQGRRTRNPVVWVVGVGCGLVLLCALCIIVAAVALYIRAAPVSTSGLLWLWV
jgi:hypothetical protein